MWCQLKMSSNKSNNSPLVWQMGLWSMKTYVPLQVIQRLSVNWQSEKRTSISQDMPATSSVLNEKEIYRNIYNHTKAGHHQCAKAISLALVDMIQMKKGEPENWTKLAKTHVIRHTGQVLPLSLSGSRCSLKSISGLSHRRKWSQAQQFSWLLSKPACAEYSQPSETQKRTSVSFLSSD